MGMSAGQARLLSVTARLTDNELRSQMLTNSKLRLADKSTEASNKYMDALNSQQLMYTSYDGSGNKLTEALTANTILTFADLKNQYAMVNTAGQVLVSGTDIKNFEASDNLTDFVTKYGIGFVDNPNYPEKLTEIYGSDYEKFADANGNYSYSNITNDLTVGDIESLEAEINKLASVDVRGMSEQEYADLTADFETALASANLTEGKNDTIYGNFYNSLDDKPAWMEDPSLNPISVPNELDPSDYASIQSTVNSFYSSNYMNWTNNAVSEGRLYFLKSCLNSGSVSGVSYYVSPDGLNLSVAGQAQDRRADALLELFNQYSSSESVNSIRNKIYGFWC